MAIGMAVITGALVTGDSVRTGLQNLVGIRLGQVDFSISTGDRFVTDSLAVKMSASLGVPVCATLQIGGSATAGGGSIRIPKVQVFGIEPTFTQILGSGTFEAPINENEAVISDNLASRLDVKVGDEILIRLNKPGPVPIDAPFVSNEENIVTGRVTVKEIAGNTLHGRFHLQNTQSAPFNIFVSREYLQRLTDRKGLSNLLLLDSKGKTDLAQLRKALAQNRTLTDAGLHLIRHPETGEWVLRSPRVFFDEATLQSIQSVPSDKTLWFSYFVNEINFGGHRTPYSFASTLPDNQVKPGEILINRWLADDLGAKPGDSLSMSYFMVGPLRKLSTEQERFRISGIIPMDDPRCDRKLMPEIPGLSDAGNCRDWETSIPINLDMIRDKDESYWKEFGGTPKAFINSGQAVSLWKNRFGAYTQVRFPATTKYADIEKNILSNLDASELGFQFTQPAREGHTAASSGVDFSGLFLGLSFFLIAGGIILTILLIRLGLEGRLAQIGTLRSLGWPEKRIRRLYLAENSLVAVFGTLLGLALTYGYTLAIFKALNGVWNDIVLTDSLRPVFLPLTLIAGVLISLLVSFGSAWVALAGYFRRRTSDLMRRNTKKVSIRFKLMLTLLSAGTSLGALLLLIIGLFRMHSVGPTWFFSAGTLLLLGFILLAVRILRYRTVAPNRIFTLGSLGKSNIWRNRNRSLSVILLFSIGIFMVVAIGANKKGPEAAGTGRFLFYLETTVPIPENLNDPLVRAKYGLETPSDFVQMKMLEGDDASCLNLNRVSNPPLLGVPSGAFEGRFSFAAETSGKFKEDPWRALDQELPGGAIPAIADQTVIQWGLGLKLGDTLKYKAESGDTIKIVLVAGLTNSIFQGKMLISERHFLRYWPSVSGTRISLIGASSESANSISDEIHRVFRDYGADLVTTEKKLAEFNSIENTYLSIFLMMGALAMLLGTVGLAIVLARNLQERRAEMALLRATGFSRMKILWLVTREYGMLLLYGTLSGGISSLLSVLPGLVDPAGTVSPWFLISIILVLLVNGLGWILLLGWQAIAKPGIVQSLRDE